jgi:predicted Zn finger-like uncharacterized protein
VVVVCESCSTRFRIDDARIPAKGRLVRCSQCKATFIAKPEDANFEDTVQEVVAEVTGSGGSPVPEPAADLFDAGGEDLGGATATRAAAPNDEERWEFDEEPRKPEPAPRSEPHFERPSAPEAASSSLDEIGDPTEWDLLRGSVEPAAREAQFVEAPEPPKAREPERRFEPERHVEPEPFLRPLAEEPEEEAEPERVRAPKRSSGRGAAVGRSLVQAGRLVLTATAWVALAGVVFTGVTPLLASDDAPSASRPAAPRTVGLADGEARGVQTSFVENAFASPLFVVRGELARPNGDPHLGLRVHFLDAHGARIGDAAWAGASRPAQVLREHAPAALRSELEESAATAALGGPFVAIFEAVPPEAQGIGLALEPLAVPPPAAEEATAPAEATASSPPSPRPSSE